MLFTFPNILSLIRGGLAFVFLCKLTSVRILALGLAMISDFFDGFLARKYKIVSEVGVILDPLMDKFFVFFAAVILYLEGAVNIKQLLALGARDISLFLFCLYLVYKKDLKHYKISAMLTGKIATLFQFVVLILISLSITVPEYVYNCFFVIGVAVLVELFIRYYLQNRKRVKICLKDKDPL